MKYTVIMSSEQLLENDPVSKNRGVIQDSKYASKKKPPIAIGLLGIATLILSFYISFKILIYSIILSMLYFIIKCGIVFYHTVRMDYNFVRDNDGEDELR